MKKTIQLAIFFITSFWILLAVFPVQSHASETGQCGDSVYYELNDNGTVRIYGSGIMWDYPFAPENPEQLSPFRKAGSSCYCRPDTAAFCSLCGRTAVSVSYE